MRVIDRDRRRPRAFSSDPDAQKRHHRVQQATREGDRYDAGLDPEQLEQLLIAMMRDLDLYLPSEEVQ